MTRRGYESSYTKTISSTSSSQNPGTTKVNIETYNRDLGNPNDPGKVKQYNNVYPNFSTSKIRFKEFPEYKTFRKSGFNPDTRYENNLFPTTSTYFNQFKYDVNKSTFARRRALSKVIQNINVEQAIRYLTSCFNRISYNPVIRNSRLYRVYKDDITYLENKKKLLSFEKSISNIIPFRLSHIVQGKDLVFTNGEKVSECDIGNIESDFIDYGTLAKLISKNDPNNIITARYGGDLKGICILNHCGNNSLVVNAFAVSKGFRTPFIKFLEILRNNNYKYCKLVVADTKFPQFWTRYNFNIDIYGNPIL